MGMGRAPSQADALEGRAPTKRLEASGEVVGRDEGEDVGAVSGVRTNETDRGG